jgi:hypothetical protein
VGAARVAVVLGNKDFVPQAVFDCMGFVEAQKSVRDHGIKSVRDYRQRYPEINEELKKAGKPGLPSLPEAHYEGDG